MTTGTRYARKLSGVERFSMVINEIHRYNVDGLLVGTGTIETSALRNAVSVAAQANPGMRVRLRGMLGFCKWVDSGIAPEVFEVQAPHWDFNSDSGADFLKQPFTPLSGGPIADVYLVRSGDRTGVIFRSLHAAADGRGIMHWGSEVFRALRGEPLIGGESTAVDFEVAEQFRDRCGLDEVKAAKKNAPVYMPVVSPSSTSDEHLRYIWRTVAIPKRITTILPRMAVYLAAYARAQNERAQGPGDSIVGFTVPVDYRGLRVEANSTGNLTGYLRINVAPEDTPKTVMQQINRQLREYVDCRMPLLAGPMRWVPVKLLVHQLRKGRDMLLYTQNTELPSGGLVSMGHNDLEAYSTPTFTCERAAGIPGSVGKLNIVAVNCSNTTYVTFSTPQNYNRDGQLDRMIDDFVAEFSQ